MANPPNKTPRIDILGSVLTVETEHRPGTGEKKGFYSTKIMILCGVRPVYIRQSSDQPPINLPKSGDLVAVNPVPNWKDNGVLTFDATLDVVQ